MTFKSPFLWIIMFIGISCRCGNIFLFNIIFLNKYYYAMKVCPSLCMQPCYLEPFCMVKEEEKCESHDTLVVTSSNPLLTAFVEQKFILCSIFHIFITMSPLFRLVNHTRATLLCILSLQTNT